MAKKIIAKAGPATVEIDAGLQRIVEDLLAAALQQTCG